MEHFPVVIIGAGIAGLTCATYLQSFSIPYLIVEADHEVGGRVQTDKVQGFQLDRGFQIFLTSYPEAKKILDYEALDFKAFRSGAMIRQQNRFIQLVNPLKEPLSVLQDLFSPVGTLLDKTKILQLVAQVSSKTEEVIFAQKATSTGDFLRSYGWSSKMINNFFRPFFGGVFLESELTTSSNFFEFVFKQFAVADAVLPMAGIQAIPQQLAAKLPPDAIRLNTSVQKIEENKVFLSNGSSLQAEAIVLAVDAASAGNLTGSTQIHNFNYTTCLYFSAGKSPLDTPMLVINSQEDAYINNMCVPSDIAPAYAPAGKALISVSVVKPHVLAAQELLKHVTRELQEWFGEQVLTWQHLKTYHIPQALPAFNADEKAERQLQIGENLYRCGDYTAYPSTNGAMQSGRKVAELIKEKVKGMPISSK